MRLKQSLSSILIIAFLGSCSTTPDSEQDFSKPLTQYEFVLQDSLTINYLAGLFVISGRSDNGLFLGLDFMDNSVLLIDEFGGIPYSFNRQGGEPWAFGNYLYAIDFFNDSTITILSENGIFFYSLEGDLMNRLLNRGGFRGFQINSQLQLLPVNLDNKPYLLTLTDFDTDLSIVVPGFYEEAKYFTFINAKTNSRKFSIKLDNSSLYRNGEYFYPDRISPIFDVNREKRELYVKYPLGDILYTYTLDIEPKLKRTTDLNPEHLAEPIGVPFDKPDSYLGFSTNGFYSHIYSRNDSTFLFYTTAFDLGKFAQETELNFFDNPAGYYNDYRHLYTANYCQVFVNDEKLCHDIKLPQEAGFVAWVDHLDYLLLNKESNGLGYEEDSKIYYIYKLEPVLIE